MKLANRNKQRLMLAQQYRDADFNPIDRLTITPEELDECVKMLSKYFTFIMSQVVSQKNLASAQGQTVNPQSSQQAPTKSTASVQADAAPSLSTANLQEHQKILQSARQASVQKSHNNHSGNRAPAAPTSPQPPFPLGGQSPQGVPTKYAHRANELTQDKLIFPPNKKRKSNQPPSAASTPAQTHTIVTTKSPSQANKVIPREAPRSKATTTMIKCPVADCQAKINGFSSQADLDNHVSEFHEPKEPPIEDPLQWALEQMRYGLGLDENGDPKPQQAEVKREKDVPEATKMKKSGSSQDQITIKQESSTPMARIPTQTGTSKTPQALVDTKIAMSTVSSTSNNPKISNSKLINSEGKNERSPSPDPWASSLVSSEVITEVWSGLQDLQSLVSWGTVQSTLTPASTLSSNKSERNSPRVSDISENDAVKINLTVGDKDSKLDQSDQDWIPAQWLEEGLYGDMESLTVHNNMLGMDWETAFGKDDTEMAVNGGPAKVGSATMDDAAPSAEFLRIYGREH